MEHLYSEGWYRRNLYLISEILILRYLIVYIEIVAVEKLK